MAERVKDGGPAFPQSDLSQYDIGPSEYGNSGMSLRDYFAIHCDQPGQAEIIRAAGLEAKSSAGYFVVMNNGTEIPFEQWWQTISQQDRFNLYAMVRYQMADAMLKARNG